MKKIFLFAILACCTGFVFGQKVLPIDSVATAPLNEKVVVTAKVFGVKATEKMTFINLGAAYPKSPLTVVIFAKDLSNFKQLPASLYTDKTIAVTGVLIDYKGKREIVVTKPEEIVVQ
jgi:DNA/RNA endonuclease YhcR with UshA esterase domain